MLDIIKAQLRDGGVDTTKLLASLNSALQKTAEKKSSFTENNKGFSGSRSWDVKRASLLVHEEHALSIAAFNTAMEKAQKLWGLATFEVPEAMIGKALTQWPYVAKSVEVEA